MLLLLRISVLQEVLVARPEHDVRVGRGAPGRHLVEHVGRGQLSRSHTPRSSRT